GSSVAVSANGNTALIGSPDENNSAGAAWVFTRSGATWSQQAKITPSGAAANVSFGGSVALSGDGNTALIGGPGEGGGGAAWVFNRSGSTWSELEGMVGSGAVGSARQGSTVALSGDGNTALVGGPGDNSFT